MKIYSKLLALNLLLVTNFVFANEKCPLSLTSEFGSRLAHFDDIMEGANSQSGLLYPVVAESAILTIGEGEADFINALLELKPGGDYYAINEEQLDQNTIYDMQHRYHSPSDGFLEERTHFDVENLVYGSWGSVLESDLRFNQILAAETFAARVESLKKETAASVLKRVVGSLDFESQLYKDKGTLRLAAPVEFLRWEALIRQIGQTERWGFVIEDLRTGESSLGLVIKRVAENQFFVEFL